MLHMLTQMRASTVQDAEEVCQGEGAQEPSQVYITITNFKVLYAVRGQTDMLMYYHVLNFREDL